MVVAGSTLRAATRGSCVRSGWVVEPELARPGLAWERPKAGWRSCPERSPNLPPGLEADCQTPTTNSEVKGGV